MSACGYRRKCPNARITTGVSSKTDIATPPPTRLSFTGDTPYTRYKTK